MVVKVQKQKGDERTAALVVTEKTGKRILSFGHGLSGPFLLNVLIFIPVAKIGVGQVKLKPDFSQAKGEPKSASL